MNLAGYFTFKNFFRTQNHFLNLSPPDYQQHILLYINIFRHTDTHTFFFFFALGGDCERGYKFSTIFSILFLSGTDRISVQTQLCKVELFFTQQPMYCRSYRANWCNCLEVETMTQSKDLTSAHEQVAREIPRVCWEIRNTQKASVTQFSQL